MHLWFPRNTHSLMKRRAAPSQPPKIIYFCKFRPKRAWNYAYLACNIIFLGKRAPRPLQPHTYTFWEKRDWICAFMVPPKYTFSYKKKGCPLWPPEIIYFCKFRPKNGLKLCVFSLHIFSDRQGDAAPLQAPKSYIRRNFGRKGTEHLCIYVS